MTNSDDDRKRITQDGEWTVSLFDYVIHRGQYYQVVRDEFEGSVLLKEVDEVPEEYIERWKDE